MAQSFKWPTRIHGALSTTLWSAYLMRRNFAVWFTYRWTVGGSSFTLSPHPPRHLARSTCFSRSTNWKAEELLGSDFFAPLQPSGLIDKSTSAKLVGSGEFR